MLWPLNLLLFYTFRFKVHYYLEQFLNVFYW